MYEKVNKVLVNIQLGVLPYRDNEIMKVVVPDSILPYWSQKVSVEEGLSKLGVRELEA